MKENSNHADLTVVTKRSVLETVRKLGKWSGYIAPNKVEAEHANDGNYNGCEIEVYLSELPDSPEKYYVVTRDGDVGFEKFLASFRFYNCDEELGQDIRLWGGNDL